ncbi:MAG: hypothetical protein ACMXYG_03720 [Candidatus Woesearchaeota archaeon]
MINPENSNIEDYQPEWSTNELLVRYEKGISHQFLRELLRNLGYQVSDKKYDHDDAVILIADSLEHEKIRKHLAKYPEFINSIDRRDLRYDRRVEGLDRLVQMTQDLPFNLAELPNKYYVEELEKVIAYIKELKP